MELNFDTADQALALDIALTEADSALGQAARRLDALQRAEDLTAEERTAMAQSRQTVKAVLVLVHGLMARHAGLTTAAYQAAQVAEQQLATVPDTAPF